MSTAFLMRLIVTAVLALPGASILVGCAEAKSTVDVSVHGVNYSGTAFSYYLIDPGKPSTDGVGELIDPFAGGGTVCCFSLPKIWRPGIKVQIHATHWLPNRPDGSLPEVKNVHVVDVPRYVNNKPGELWVMRAADGSMSVVSSDFQPDHPKWPGNIKGWPVPSLEYRRERWELIKNHEEEGVKFFLSMLEELEREPQSHAKKMWEGAQQYDSSSIKGYSGPDDPRFRTSLKSDYTEGLERSRKLLEGIMRGRP